MGYWEKLLEDKFLPKSKERKSKEPKISNVQLTIFDSSGIRYTSDNLIRGNYGFGQTKIS